MSLVAYKPADWPSCLRMCRQRYPLRWAVRNRHVIACCHCVCVRSCSVWTAAPRDKETRGASVPLPCCRDSQPLTSSGLSAGTRDIRIYLVIQHSAETCLFFHKVLSTVTLCSVGVATTYGLDDLGVGVRVPIG
jgi:hypothetical protein